VKKFLPLFSTVLAVVVAGFVAWEFVGRPLLRPKGPRAGYFPNVLLTTHEGKTVRFYDDLMHGDKIVVVNFMYTQCKGGCIGATDNLVKVQQAVGGRAGRDIFFYSITLDPESDTPAALKEYAELHETKPGWLFLTGKKADLELIRQRLGFVDVDPAVDARKVEHAGVILFGNEALNRWGACPALGQPNEIIRSLSSMERPDRRRLHATDTAAVPNSGADGWTMNGEWQAKKQ
jgi:protein SCO1/2